MLKIAKKRIVPALVLVALSCLSVGDAMAQRRPRRSRAGAFWRSQPVGRATPRVTTSRSRASRTALQYYPKYYYGFHERYFQEFAYPLGIRGVRGTAW